MAGAGGPSGLDHGNGSRSYRSTGSPRPQSEEHRRQSAAQPFRGGHRPVRVGQVVAGLRHHLCRRAAAVRGIAVGLRPPVSRAGREAGRGPDRRSLTRHFHRTEDHRIESPLHRRHRHRDLRLPAPVVRQHRCAALSGVRAADYGAVGRPHRREGLGRSRRRAHQRAGPDRARPQGRVQEGPRRPAGQGVREGPGRWADTRPRRGSPARTPPEPRYRGPRRPAGHPVRGGAPAAERHRARAEPRRRRGHHQHPAGGRPAVLPETGVRAVRRERAGDHAAGVLVQLPAGRLRRLSGPRGRRRLRPRPHRAGRREVVERGGDRPVGRRRREAGPGRARGVEPTVRHRSRYAVRPVAPPATRHPAAGSGPGEAIGGGGNPTRRPGGASRSDATSRGSCRTCGGATRREPGPSRSASSPCAPSMPAPPAAGSVSGPRAGRCA